MNAKKPRSLSREKFLVLGGGAIAGLAACGGGGGGGQTPTTPTASSSPVTIPTTTPSTGPTSAPTSVPTTVTITRTSTSGQLLPKLTGLSYEKASLAEGLFSGSNTSLIGYFKTLGPSTVRIGGITGDNMTYEASGGGVTTGQVAPSDIDRLASFLVGANWRAIYQINLASNTTANAAAEAAYVANSLGGNLLAFELGNEPNQYGLNGDRPSSYTYDEFKSEWLSYVNAILASVPSALFVGPGCSGDISTWTKPFAADEGNQINSLTHHYFRGGPSSSETISYLLTADPALESDLEILTTATGGKIPGGFRLDEVASFYDGGSFGVSDTYAAALWAINLLLSSAEFGAAAVNFHGGGTASYTPIVDNGATATGVRPQYYGLLMATQISPGPMYPVKVSSTLNLLAYAIDGSDGDTYVVIINNDSSTSAITTINLGVAQRTVTQLVLSGPSLSSTSGVTLGGAAVGGAGAWSPATSAPVAVDSAIVNVTVAPASALLLKFT